ncbi:nitrate reductase subunit beta [Alicyclobacillaceae bacterium I2511]|nr:nitrate reductase subunit beta [Alicyclobacillaceae bacterium I2511]
MKIKAQIAMVMNLDKCIGCHTCSVTCKNTWTNRPGTEYMWFNNVETRPGPGYPQAWEDQDHYRGGWMLNRQGQLELRSGNALSRLANIFYNPDLPTVDDYYEPWTYDYENLIHSPHRKHQPVARPRSLLTGKRMDKPVWGPNWDDDLAGGKEIAPRDPNLRGIEDQVAFAYEQAFMMYLPRICEHCLNPSCVAACPSGAMYKRDEDGIVLVDQEACRGWRFCMTACPYKKVYFNWNTHKAEKCNFCFPRIESGLPTVCSETCVGRIRYLGPVFYDADRVKEAAAVTDVRELYPSQLSVFLNPHDPEVIHAAREAGISEAWIEGAQQSPVYKMAVEWGVALPLHPEYRTLPMVWYVPPLSPMVNLLQNEAELSAQGYITTVDEMRIPVSYLASILTAGDESVIRKVLLRLVAMRVSMRSKQLHGPIDDVLLQEAGITQVQVEEMARLFGVAKYAERFVIPTGNRNGDRNLAYTQGACSLEEIAPPEGVLPPVQRDK